MGTKRTVTVTGDVDYKAMAKQAEAELKELAKEEAARAAQSYEQAVAHSHDIERINLVCARACDVARVAWAQTVDPTQMNMINIAFKVLIETSLGYASIGEEHGPLHEVSTSTFARVHFTSPPQILSQLSSPILAVLCSLGKSIQTWLRWLRFDGDQIRCPKGTVGNDRGLRKD